MEQFFASWDADVENPAKDKKELYDAMTAKLKEHPGEIEVLWRMVQACLMVADSFEKVKNKNESKKYTEESLVHAKRAIEVAPQAMLAHKWYCASVGRMAPHVSTKERIKFGHEFKEHRDIAVEIESNDQLMHHMYGRWCYEVASLSFIERKIAETFFAKPPTATYAEALESLMKADELKHDWICNHLWIAKAHIALKNYAQAIQWIDSGLAMPSMTEEDAVAQNELKDLQKSYAKYRK